MLKVIFSFVNFINENDWLKVFLLFAATIIALIYFGSEYYDCEYVKHGVYVKQFFGGYTCVSQ
jgi:hypothetical protein